MWSYDLTKVEIPIKYFREPYKNSNISYEFEIECKNINQELDNQYLTDSICMKIADILQIGEPNEKIDLKKALFV